MVSRPPSAGGAVAVVGGLIIAAVIAAVLGGVFIMLGTSVLHEYFPAVPAFSLFESMILSLMWSTLFMRVSND